MNFKWLHINRPDSSQSAIFRIGDSLHGCRFWQKSLVVDHRSELLKAHVFHKKGRAGLDMFA
ncbi:Unknown protein sequence [Pseudomonas syringae pv. cunninghamiae]|nr:Unknown protein sequence [Pseudomonas syringae pv. cunninghamiae]